MRIEKGVRTTTASAITQLIENIIPRIAAMVITPVKSCVKPIRRPSEKESMSAVMRLRISPEE